MNLDQRQPGFPSTSCLNISSPLAWNTYRGSGYLLYRQGKNTRRQNHLFAVFAPEARHHLPRWRMNSARTRLRWGIIATEHDRDIVPEHVFWRQAQGHAAQAGPDKGDHIVIRPLAYCPEKDIRPLCARHGISNHSVQSVRLAGKHATQNIKAMLSAGSFNIRAQPNHIYRDAERRALASAGW